MFSFISSFRAMKNSDYPLTICRTSKNGRLNFELIEGIVRLLLEILKLICDSDVEWITIEKGDER